MEQTQKKRGRPPKYNSDEERKEALRQQYINANRKYYAKIQSMRTSYQKIHDLIQKVF